MSLIENILTDMKDDLTDVQAEKLKLSLILRCKNYDITEKITDVAVSTEDINEKYLKRFFAYKSLEGLSEKSLKTYKFTIDKALRFINKPIPEITGDDIFLYIASTKSKGLSDVYLRNIRQTLSCLFGWFYHMNIINENPMACIHPIKTGKYIKEAFSDVEIEKLRTTVSNIRDRAIIEVLLTSGVRVSEMCSMDIDSVDFSNNTIKILGKGNKERFVYMSNVSRMYLKQYLDSRVDNNPALFVYKVKPYKRMQPPSVQRVLKVLGRKCNVSKVHPHRFRRTLATNLLNKGMPLEEVSRILGHEKLDTTLEYCNISEVAVHNEYNRIIG